MWTSEDGTLMSLAITTRIDWPAVLKFEFQHILTTEGEGFDKRRGKLRYVEQRWVGQDYFDGGGPSRTGKVWFLTDDATDFPVIEYTLKIPR